MLDGSFRFALNCEHQISISSSNKQAHQDMETSATQAKQRVAPAMDAEKEIDTAERGLQSETMENGSNHHEEKDVMSVETDNSCFSMQRAFVAGIHVAFVTFSILLHFIHEWSNDSKFVAWLAATDESVVQHLKMMLWPWLILLVPLDMLSKVCNHASQGGSTWYLKRIKKASLLNICQANLAALTCSMLFAAGIFRLYTAIADTTHNLIADIVIFVVAVSAGPILRIWLLGRERVAGWLVLFVFAYGLIWFFVYFSYEENAHEGFWLDPHGDSKDEHDH